MDSLEHFLATSNDELIAEQRKSVKETPFACELAKESNDEEISSKKEDQVNGKDGDNNMDHPTPPYNPNPLLDHTSENTVTLDIYDDKTDLSAVLDTEGCMIDVYDEDIIDDSTGPPGTHLFDRLVNLPSTTANTIFTTFLHNNTRSNAIIKGLSDAKESLTSMIAEAEDVFLDASDGYDSDAADRSNLLDTLQESITADCSPFCDLNTSVPGCEVHEFTMISPPIYKDKPLASHIVPSRVLFGKVALPNSIPQGPTHINHNGTLAPTETLSSNFSNNYVYDLVKDVKKTLAEINEVIWQDGLPIGTDIDEMVRF